MSRRRLLALLRSGLVIALLIGHAMPAGAVLCVADRGHHAIELVAAERCHGAGETTVAGARDDGCPDACTDTPLRGGAEIRSPGAGDLGLQTAALVSHASVPLTTQAARSPGYLRPVILISSTVTRLRSTVLLR